MRKEELTGHLIVFIFSSLCTQFVYTVCTQFTIKIIIIINYHAWLQGLKLTFSATGHCGSIVL